jgi:hypothetical protein
MLMSNLLVVVVTLVVLLVRVVCVRPTASGRGLRPSAGWVARHSRGSRLIIRVR